MNLSKQQWLVYCCWVGGMTRQQTAYSLGVTLETVKTHRDRIRKKTGQRSPYQMGTPDHG